MKLQLIRNQQNRPNIISVQSTLTTLCFLLISACSSNAKAPTEEVLTSPYSTHPEQIPENQEAYAPSLSEPSVANSSNTLNQLENLIEKQEFGLATEISSKIDESSLALKDQSRLNLSKATLSATQNNSAETLQLLNKVQYRLLNKSDTASYFWLKARALYQTGKQQQSLEALASRSNYLTADQAGSNNSMMKSIAAIMPEQQRRKILKSTPNKDLSYWLEATQFNNTGSTTPINQFENTTQLTAKLSKTKPVWSEVSPKKITVLLPFSSNLAPMAAEFKKGFSEAHELNTSPNKPEVVFYDIGAGDLEEKILLADSNDTDFIVGPLGNKQSNIALYNSSNTPILTIGGYLQEKRQNRYTFSLNPEADSIAIANHARQKGLTHALVFTANNSRGERLASAFENAWTTLNGTYERYQYNTTDFDHSAIIKHSLGIYDSENRYSKISNTLGMKPKFTSSRKSNIDMIFLASSLEDSKNLKPQLNYFDAHNVPTYGPSNINKVSASASEKADLDGLIIPEMPAIIEYDKKLHTPKKILAEQSSNIDDITNEETDDITSISRLEILGFDTYQTISIIPSLETRKYAYQGKSGNITLSENGNIQHQPSWAKLSNGILKKVR